MRSFAPRYQKKKKKRGRKWIFSLFFFVLFFSFLIWGSYREELRVHNVNIKGNHFITSEELKRKIKEQLSQRAFLFFPRDNIFFLNLKKITRSIENEYPLIYSVKAERKKRELSFSIEERKPSSLWCEEGREPLFFNELCYFADQRAYIYSRAPFFSDGIFQKIYIQNKDTLAIGEQLMTEKEYQNFLQLVEELSKKFDIEIENILFEKTGMLKMFIKRFSSQKFNDDRPYLFLKRSDLDKREELERNISIMMEHHLFKKQFAQRENRLDFIDLSIPEQIRFHFKKYEKREG